MSQPCSLPFSHYPPSQLRRGLSCKIHKPSFHAGCRVGFISPASTRAVVFLLRRGLLSLICKPSPAEASLALKKVFRDDNADSLKKWWRRHLHFYAAVRTEPSSDAGVYVYSIVLAHTVSGSKKNNDRDHTPMTGSTRWGVFLGTCLRHAVLDALALSNERAGSTPVALAA